MLVADVLSAVLAVVFGSAAIAKLVHQRQQVRTAEKLHIPWSRYRWIGAPEAAASVGLLIGYASVSTGEQDLALQRQHVGEGRVVELAEDRFADELGERVRG